MNCHRIENQGKILFVQQYWDNKCVIENVSEILVSVLERIILRMVL